MSERLGSKVVLITGGANGISGKLMGFGGAFAWMAARAGAVVVVTDVDESLGSQTAEQISATGAEAIFLHLDVTNSARWDEVVSETVSRFGGIDVLVSGAGIQVLHDIEHTTDEIWRSAMDVHAMGVFLGIRTVAPVMRDRGGGSMVNISSIAAMVGSQSNTAYHAAKGAIYSLTKSAAIQLAPDRIRVNSVLPGYADTPFTVGPFSAPGALEGRLARVPMGRLGTADEVASAILYLASDEASYVTGTELAVDGGLLAQ